MERKKQFFSILRTGLFGLAACSLLFAGCSNLKDDVDELKAQMNDVKSQMATIQAWVATGQLYTGYTGDGTNSDLVLSFTNGKSVTIPKGNLTTLDDTSDPDFFIISVSQKGSGTTDKIKIPKVSTANIPTSITILKSDAGVVPFIAGVPDMSTVIRVNPSNIDPAKLAANLFIDDVSSYASSVTSSVIKVGTPVAIEPGTYRLPLTIDNVSYSNKFAPGKLYVAFYDGSTQNIGVTSATPLNEGFVGNIVVLPFTPIADGNIFSLENNFAAPVYVGTNFGFSQVKDTMNLFSIVYPKSAIQKVEYFLLKDTKTAKTDVVDFAAVTGQLAPQYNGTASAYPFEVTPNDAKFTAAADVKVANVLIIVTDIKGNTAKRLYACTGQGQLNLPALAYPTWSAFDRTVPYSVPATGQYPVTYKKTFPSTTSTTLAAQPSEVAPVGPYQWGKTHTLDASSVSPSIWAKLPTGWTQTDMATFNVTAGVLNAQGKLVTDSVRNNATVPGSTTLNYVTTTNVTPGSYTVTFRHSDSRVDPMVYWKAGHYDIPMPIVVTGYKFKANVFSSNVMDNINAHANVHTSFWGDPTNNVTIKTIVPYADNAQQLFNNATLASGSLVKADVDAANAAQANGYAIGDVTLVFVPQTTYVKANPDATLNQVVFDTKVEPTMAVAIQVPAGAINATANNLVAGTHLSPLYPVTIYNVNGVDKLFEEGAKFPLVVNALKYSADKSVATAISKKRAFFTPDVVPTVLNATDYLVLKDIEGTQYASVGGAYSIGGTNNSNVLKSLTFVMSTSTTGTSLSNFITCSSTGAIAWVGTNVAPTEAVSGIIKVNGEDVWGVKFEYSINISILPN